MANEPTIEQMGEVIAAFMGYKKREKLYPTDRQILEGEGLPNWYEDSLKYHTSWDWLMPVVEKICSLLKDHHLTIEIMSTYNSAYFWSLESGQREIANKSEDKLIDTVYAAVYQFIQWYNKQKQKDANS